MAGFFNFNKITPPAPNDPTVNEEVQLNQNWDQLDTKLQSYINGGPISNIEVGQEIFDNNFNYCVWTGSSTRKPDDIVTSWSSWTNIPILSPRAPRPNFTPKWRNNSAYRMVELVGGILFDSASSAWTLGVLHTINSDTTGAIPASFAPIGGLHISQAAAGLSAGTTVVAAGHIQIDKPAGNTYTRIRAQYLGGPGGGNFIMLDQVWWFY